MPIITKPVNIEKNVAALFTLDKSALAVLPSVSSDIYFSNSTNWNRVLLFYKSSVGNQKKILKFDATQVSPTSNFLASNKARNIFEIQKILIVDFDNGIFEVPRSQLTVSEFDVDMTPILESILASQSSLQYSSFRSFYFTSDATGQSFNLNANSIITKIATRLYRSGNPVMDMSMKIIKNSDRSIIATSTNQISSSSLTQVPYGLPTQWDIQDSEFTFSNVQLLSGVDYTFIVYPSSITSWSWIDSVSIVANGSNLYPNGALDSDGTGNNMQPSYDLYFKIYGYAEAAASPIAWENPAPDVYNIEADGGLTNGVNRGSSLYYNIFDNTNILSGDFELIFNVGNWTHDSAFGIRTVNNPSTFSGAVGYGGGTSNNIHVNDLVVGVISSGLSGKQWKIKRVGATTSFYTDGVLSYTTTLIVGAVQPVATLSSGGTLISATVV